MIIKDLDYKTVILKFEKTGYVKTAYSQIKAAKMTTGVGVLTLLGDPENPNEAPSIDYPNLDTLLEKKPSDVVVIDFKEGHYQFMTLGDVLEKREQEKGKESELYDTPCRCCD